MMKAFSILPLCLSLFAGPAALAWSESQYKARSDEQLKKTLSEEQFKVTRKDGTEPSYQNAFWNEHRDGIYVDVVSGEPLFSSLDKYDSKTGWPSFTKPLEAKNVLTREDKSLLPARTEVRSAHANSHLGHLFDDGPQPTGKRYCMNSAALRFIPAKDLVKEGYGEYAHLFKASSPAASEASAIFAGGCFWSMQKAFEQLRGVSRVEAGYSGGASVNPSYEDVSTGKTGHREAIRVTYDPAQISYVDLLSWYWRQIDPTQVDGQFVDQGDEYRAAIFYRTEAERKMAEESKAELARSKRFKKPIATEIMAAQPFYPAEAYHQDFYLTHAPRYDSYRKASGRPQFFSKSWAQDYNLPKLMKNPAAAH